jgi:hypothetical protein
VIPPFAPCKLQVWKFARSAMSHRYRTMVAGRRNDEEFNEENTLWLDTQDPFAGFAVAKE